MLNVPVVIVCCRGLALPLGCGLVAAGIAKGRYRLRLRRCLHVGKGFAGEQLQSAGPGVYRLRIASSARLIRRAVSPSRLATDSTE
jgi:hypothetical protein